MRPTARIAMCRRCSGFALVFAIAGAGTLQAQAAISSELSQKCQDRVRQRFSVPSLARFATPTSNAPGDGTIEIRGRVEGLTDSDGYRQYDYECRMLRRAGAWVADPVTLSQPGRSDDGGRSAGMSDSGGSTNGSFGGWRNRDSTANRSR